MDVSTTARQRQQNTYLVRRAALHIMEGCSEDEVRRFLYSHDKRKANVCRVLHRAQDFVHLGEPLSRSDFADLDHDIEMEVALEAAKRNKGSSSAAATAAAAAGDYDDTQSLGEAVAHELETAGITSDDDLERVPVCVCTVVDNEEDGHPGEVVHHLNADNICAMLTACSKSESHEATHGTQKRSAIWKRSLVASKRPISLSGSSKSSATSLHCPSPTSDGLGEDMPAFDMPPSTPQDPHGDATLLPIPTTPVPPEELYSTPPASFLEALAYDIQDRRDRSIVITSRAVGQDCFQVFRIVIQKARVDRFLCSLRTYHPGTLRVCLTCTAATWAAPISETF